ncbi:helix-turn-helix transcriptional regulator [Methylobacterium sp. E-066]|uniref:helix-turn-helix transcriptional regulator n=1 Tax=Methylobacterium sp. E-066 TaxID=2836584 RepID=UPI001FBB0ED5|nr:helix-turn-helix domain-containing protein [Methylobacterium sp. E-066]MCJ2139421.1 helix-turn-helix domain-containing protein [Methylobacterium sp. E-066]
MAKQKSLDLKDEPAFTTGPAARYMGVGHSTLNKWRREGRAPAHFTLSWRKFLWRKHDLDAFMAARRVEAAVPTSTEEGRS